MTMISNFGGVYLDPVYSTVSPAVTDNAYKEGQIWVDMTTDTAWILTDISVLGVAKWELLTSGSPGSGSYIGSWISTATYAAGDMVNYNGTLYEYIDPVPSAGAVPGTSPKWEVYMKNESIYSITDPDSTTPAVVITASNDRFTAVGHGLLDGMAVKFAVGGGGALPPEIVAGTTYYVTGATASYFKVSATYGGAIINISVDSTAPVTFQTVDAATSTYVVDRYAGSLITLTAPGLAQILRAPSHASAGKEFSVINDGTSGANTIIIQWGSGSVSLHAGESQKFIWDGAEWVIGTGIDADDVDYTPHGEVTQINVQDAIDKLIDIRWQKRAYNSTGAPIAAEKIVKAAGYDAGSTELMITPITGTSDVPQGMVYASHATGTTGYLLIKGEYVSSLDTSASAIDAPVYFDATGTLTLTPGSTIVGRVLTVGNPGTLYIDIPAAGSSGRLKMDNKTDPAVNYISAAIEDIFDGILITLTSAGNSQTLPAPTDVTAGKEFHVYVTSASAQYKLPVVYSTGKIDIASGQGMKFVWSGSDWMTEHQVIQQYVVVAKSGGEYTSIQTALNAITDASAVKKYTLMVAPGVYTEQITMIDYVDIVGMGSAPRATVIQSSAGTVITASNANRSDMRNLTISRTATADGANCIKISSTGTHLFYDCVIEQTSTNSSGVLVDITGTGVVQFNTGQLTLSQVGASASAMSVNALVYASGATSLYLRNVNGSLTVADTDVIAAAVFETSAATATIDWQDTNLTVTVTSNAYVGIAGIYYSSGTNINRFVQNSIFRVVNNSGAPGGAGYCYYLDSAAGGATLNGCGNIIRVTGFTNNYFAFVDTGDTLNSYFENIVAASAMSGSGTINFVHNPSDGNMELTGDVYLRNRTSNSNSKEILIEANSAGTIQTAALQTIFGADPYLRISAPNNSGTKTAVADVHDTAIVATYDNTVDIGASGANRFKDEYLSGTIYSYGANNQGATRQETTITAVALSLSNTDLYSNIIYDTTNVVTQALPLIAANVTDKVYHFINKNTGPVLVTTSTGTLLVTILQGERARAVCDGVNWNIEKVQIASKLPQYNGLVDNTKFTATYDSANRMFQVVVAAGAYADVAGTRFYIPAATYKDGTGGSTAITGNPHAATSGLYWLYIDSTGTLQVNGTPDLDVSAPIAYAEFNATTAVGLAFDERHPSTPGWPSSVHKYVHFHFGAMWYSGGAVTGHTLNSSADASLRPSVDQTLFDDESLRHTLAALTGGATAYTHAKRSGTVANGEWSYTTGNPFPIHVIDADPGAGVDYNPVHNDVSGVTVANTAITTNNRWLNVYLVGVKPLNVADAAYRYLFIQPQVLYTSDTTAAAATIDEINWGSFPFVEICPLAKIRFRRVTKTGGTDNNMNIVEVLSLRGSRVSFATGATSTSIHNNLGGRSAASAHPASAIDFDTTITGISSTTVQTAMDFYHKPQRTLTAAGTITDADTVIVFDGTADITQAMPASATSLFTKKTITFINIDAAFKVTFTPDGADTMDETILLPGERMTFILVGSNWCLL